MVFLDADDLVGPDYLFEAGQILSHDADVVNPDAMLCRCSKIMSPLNCNQTLSP